MQLTQTKFDKHTFSMGRTNLMTKPRVQYIPLCTLLFFGRSEVALYITSSSWGYQRFSALSRALDDFTDQRLRKN